MIEGHKVCFVRWHCFHCEELQCISEVVFGFMMRKTLVERCFGGGCRWCCYRMVPMSGERMHGAM